MPIGFASTTAGAPTPMRASSGALSVCCPLLARHPTSAPSSECIWVHTTFAAGIGPTLAAGVPSLPIRSGACVASADILEAAALFCCAALCAQLTTSDHLCDMHQAHVRPLSFADPSGHCLHQGLLASCACCCSQEAMPLQISKPNNSELLCRWPQQREGCWQGGRGGNSCSS